MATTRAQDFGPLSNSGSKTTIIIMSKHTFQTFLRCGICLTLASTCGSAGFALPQNGKVTKGDVTGTIINSANKLTIKTNKRSVIQWGSFNINKGEIVDFQNKGAVLNYVTPGGGVSEISGALKALDTLILINNQGINVNNGAIINVPNLLLSTGSISDSGLDAFIQGADANGTNVPLINIELKDSNGPININGSIQSLTNGDIGLLAPKINLDPDIKINSTGLRSATTGTDGVNVTVNGVEAEATLWIGTTGLPQTPETLTPGLPTGFGYLNVSGKPNNQDLLISLQGQYDIERFVVGSSGALPNEFDQLFFSPNFRAQDFYIYDGVKAISVGERESTQNGPLKRKLSHLINGHWVAQPAVLESDILHMGLPLGVDLVKLDNVKFDARGNPIGGSVQLRVKGESLGTEFANHFGKNGVITINYNGTSQGTVLSNNGNSGTYNSSTGTISWSSIQTGTTTVAGATKQTTTQTPFTATISGATHTTTTTQINTVTTQLTIPQASRSKPEGVTGAGTSESIQVVTGLYQSMGNNKPCRNSGHCFARTGSSTLSTWKGDFRQVDGRTVFVPSGQGGQKVVLINGQYFVIKASESAQTLINNNAIGTGSVNQPQPLTVSYQTTVRTPIKTTTTDPAQTVSAGSIQTTTFTPTSQTVSTQAKVINSQPLSFHFSQVPSIHKQVGSHYHLTTPPTIPEQKIPQPLVQKVPPKIEQKVPGQIPTIPEQKIPQPLVQKVPPKIEQKVPGQTPTIPEQKIPQPLVQKVPPKIEQKVPGQTPTIPEQKIPQPLVQKVPPKIEQKVPGQTPTSSFVRNTISPDVNKPEKPGPQNPIITGTRASSSSDVMSLSTDKRTRNTTIGALLPNQIIVRTSLEYQIPQRIIDQLGEKADLTKTELRLSGGNSLPQGILFEPFSETITITRSSRVNLPLEVQLSAPSPDGVKTVIFIIGIN
jgi:filamentous hemagglutinin family protein